MDVAGSSGSLRVGVEGVPPVLGIVSSYEFVVAFSLVGVCVVNWAVRLG